MTNKIRVLIVIFLTIVLFNIVIFLAPLTINLTFWSQYLFTMVAFIFQPIHLAIIFRSHNLSQDKFLFIPSVLIGLAYLVVQLIIFFTFAVLTTVPNWMSIIVGSTVLIIAIVLILMSDINKTEVIRYSTNLKSNVSFIKQNIGSISNLANIETDYNTKNLLEKLSDSFKYSDPVSLESLKELEDKITSLVNDLSKSNNKDIEISNISKLLFERNTRIKTQK